MCRRKFPPLWRWRQYAAINKFINGLDYIVNISHIINLSFDTLFNQIT